MSKINLFPALIYFRHSIFCKMSNNPNSKKYLKFCSSFVPFPALPLSMMKKMFHTIFLKNAFTNSKEDFYFIL